MTTNSIELLTCAAYGCPGCDYRHFHRTADDAMLTEIPDHGLYTAAQLAVLGRAALATGAVDAQGHALTHPRSGNDDVTSPVS